jgi:hypothetical protein
VGLEFADIRPEAQRCLEQILKAVVESIK